MKITPRPIGVEDEVDQSRDIAGFHKWARSSRTVSFIMLMLGWFTIPMEVLLRRDFGQRWLTAINFYAGVFLLLIFSVLQVVVNVVWDFIRGLISDIGSAINPLYVPDEKSLSDKAMDKSMIFFFLAYIFMGGYHLFKIWWRNRANAALHSFDDGTSRLEPLGRHLIKPINALAKPFLFFSMLLIPKKQRNIQSAPALINNPAAFTNTVLEPLLLFIVAWELHGVASLWLFISAVAVLIHANWKETARLNKVLDFRDSVLEAKVMKELKDENRSADDILMPLLREGAKTRNNNHQLASQTTPQYPTLMAIIEDMNREGSHLAS